MQSLQIFSISQVFILMLLPFCENYEFVVTGSRLPTANVTGPSVVYDGQDSIYVLGTDWWGGKADTVYKYSISTGAVDTVGKTTHDLRYGAAVMQGPDILYLGGIDKGNWPVSTVYRISTTDGTMAPDGNLPTPLAHFGISWDAVQQVAYTFGGYDTNAVHQDVQRYDPTSKLSAIVSTFEMLQWPVAVWDHTNNVYYMLGTFIDDFGIAWADLQRFDPSDGSNVTLSLKLPYNLRGPCLIFANEHVYIMNGQRPHRYSPSTGTAEEIQVNNWPTNYATAGCVYVPKLQRIYMFGAWWTTDNVRRIRTDEIFHVDLQTTLQPTPTTTPPPKKPSLTVVGTRLPTPMRFHEAVFDGDDSIYIIGGVDNGTQRQDKVLKYSISDQQVQIHGQFRGLALGAAVMDRADQSILYFGGQWKGGRVSGIQRYSIIDRKHSTVNNLPNATEMSAVAWDDTTRNAYIFGGYTSKDSYLDEVLQYSASDNKVTKIGQLPEKRYEAAAAWDSEAGVAYLFGGYGASNSMRSDVLHFNPGTRTTAKVVAPLPHLTTYPCAVGAGAQGNWEGYAFGGGALVKFNPGTQSAETVDVEGWPASLSMAACVHVPNLNRLYIIGGWGRWTVQETTSSFRNEIAYVDL